MHQNCFSRLRFTTRFTARAFVVAAIALASLASAMRSHAETLINVDFNSSSAPFASWGTYTGSGPLGGGTWNGITVPFDGQGGSSLATTSLLDSTGASSGASIAITQLWTSYNLDTTTAANIAAGLQPLMADYLYLANEATSATVTLSGLGASTEWDIVLYAAQTTDHDSAFTIGGVTKATTDPGGISTLTEPGQYVRFDNISSDGSGTITIDWARNGNAISALNGLQIMAVPEPATAFMVAVLAAGLLARARRRLPDVEGSRKSGRYPG